MTDTSNQACANLAVVVIGRNEGERLRICLSSVLRCAPGALVVYVDSGSTDASVELAKELGCAVVNLDMSRPFTAARARNEGFSKALQIEPGTAFVQFVDGDCELLEGWLAAACHYMTDHKNTVAVAGRLRERFPERSIYNRLCDFEWGASVGEVKACGGIAMFKAEAFAHVNGFKTTLIAGEEPELCVRLRALGGRIARLETEMALHDANMLRFAQWWKRSKRAGYAFAEGAFLHGAPPERHYVDSRKRAIIWGFSLPLAILLGASLYAPSLLATLIYPLQVVRLAFKLGIKEDFVWTRAIFMVIGKFPEALGILKFYRNRFAGLQGVLIEYK